MVQRVMGKKLAGDEAIVGLMLERNLEEGNQQIPADTAEMRYGVSVTDKCLGCMLPNSYCATPMRECANPWRPSPN